MKTTPHRITSTGFQNGLTIVIEPNISDYQSSLFCTFGVRVHIHDAYDYLDDNADVKTIIRKTEALINITPERTYSSDTVKELPIWRRMCYSEDERPLRFMQKYSYTNCYAECRSQMIYQQCDCVPYYMPNYNFYRICEMNDMACVHTNWKLFHMMTVNSSCDCLPSCDFNLYSGDVTTGVLDRRFSQSHYDLL